MSNQFALIEAVKLGSIHRVTQFLNDPEINPNIKDQHGFTAFHYAIINHHFEIAKIMLSHEGIVTMLNNEQPAIPVYSSIAGCLSNFPFKCFQIGNVNSVQRFARNLVQVQTETIDEIQLMIEKGHALKPKLFLDVTLSAYLNRYLSDHCIKSFYSKYNSKYHLIEMLEQCLLDTEEFNDPELVKLYYPFLHDKFSKETLEKSCLTATYFKEFETKLQKLPCYLIERAVSSDSVNFVVIELFKHLISIGFYNIEDYSSGGNMFLEYNNWSMRRSKNKLFWVDLNEEIDRDWLANFYNRLSTTTSIRRLYNLIKIFFEMGFNVDVLLKEFLVKYHLWYVPPPTNLLFKILPCLIPFTTDFFQIAGASLTHGHFSQLRQNPEVKEFFKNLLQKYGDPTNAYPLDKIFDFRFNVCPLKQLCRNVIRKRILKVTGVRVSSKHHLPMYQFINMRPNDSYSMFFELLEGLRSELPLNLLDYLKFDEIYDDIKVL